MEVDACNVFFQDMKAGIILRIKGTGYFFSYDENYVKNINAKPLSISLPLRLEPYQSKKLFPFFEGLLSEGWLKKVQVRRQKIDENDSFKLLMENGRDLIGAVSLEKVEIKNEM